VNAPSPTETSRYRLASVHAKIASRAVRPIPNASPAPPDPESAQIVSSRSSASALSSRGSKTPFVSCAYARPVLFTEKWLTSLYIAMYGQQSLTR
jgi:hypothetical protein